jgi:hypothetical protein
MKTAINLLALTATVTLFSSAFAGDGPPIGTLVPIDESKYDLNRKEFVEKNDVFNRITKEAYLREIFSVKEKLGKYVVRETQQVARPVDQEVYVVVNPQSAQKWVYQNR